MKIESIVVENFCSYNALSLSFDEIGLALLHGKTGSGKSTILDAVCWCLYGVTAKGTLSDGVRPISGSSEVTEGSIVIEVNNEIIEIVRIRGLGKNDLFWYEPDMRVCRGKDLVETQQLLSQRMGVDVDTFIAGSYFHEFSPTGTFFIAKAKERRELFEQLSNLELPNKLADKMTELKKKTTITIIKHEMEKERGVGKAEQLKAIHISTIRMAANWEKEKAKSIIELENLYKNFELDKSSKIVILQKNSNSFELMKANFIFTLKSEIEELKDQLKKEISHAVALKEKQVKIAVCPTCGQKVDNSYEEQLEKHYYRSQRLTDKLTQMEKELKREESKENTYLLQIEEVTQSENHYNTQIEKERIRINPFHIEQENVASEIVKHEDAMKVLTKNLKNLQDLNGSYKLLYDLSSLLRGELLKKAVSEVQDTTNKYLEKYFDAELIVSFELNADSLEVNVSKNGYNCAYKQLSKGQRGLLKLCFSISVQEAVSNNKGVHFENLFMDESLEGFDELLKVKAFRLFEFLSLSHSSVLIIEHNEAFKNMFTHKFLVSMGENGSYIDEEIN